MIKINLVKDLNKKNDLEIIFLNSLEKCADKKLLEELNFEIKDEASALLLESKKIYVAYEKDDFDSMAIAGASAVKKLKSTKFKRAKIVLNSKLEKSFSSLVQGAILGEYEFLKYKTKAKKTKIELDFVVSKNIEKFEKELKEAKIIADAVNKARDMVNTPPADFYPKTMAKIAKDLANDAKIQVKIEGEKYLDKNKMKSMLSVGRASVHESKLIHLSYKPKNAKKKVVLVGKGLTYDSGGLSLKPANFMVTMKADKSGGCAVLSTIWAIAKLNLPIEVHAIVGAVENMIGGNAYKPDDVLTAKNGKTIEVKNTDAEGRLVLCDCLCYAQDEIKDIDYIFNYATLTGACVVGVGEFTTGVMGNNDKLKSQVVKSAKEVGEYATALDFNRYLKQTLKSQVADICNISNSRYGGAITAGHFLDNFIYEENKNKWIHFDIAGPAFVEQAWGYNPFGASGAGVRTTVNFIKSMV